MNTPNEIEAARAFIAAQSEHDVNAHDCGECPALGDDISECKLCQARKVLASVTQHTPGPWKCFPTSHHAHDYRLEVPNAQMPFNGNDEARANARLIAAAPDLLAAATNIRNELEHWLHEAPPTRELIKGAMQELAKAIAKATT